MWPVAPVRTLRTLCATLLILAPTLLGARHAVAQDDVAGDTARTDVRTFTPVLDTVKSDSVWLRNGDIHS